MDATLQNTVNGLVTSEMAQGLVTGVTSNVTTVLPYAFGLMAIVIAWSFAKKFLHSGK